MRHAVLLLAAAFPLAACDVRTANETASVNGENAVEDMTPEGPSALTSLLGGGKAMPLSIQKQLANGAVLYITSIQAKPTETVLAVKIVNGFERDIDLNWGDKNTFLTAGGQRFFLSPPIDNKNLKVTTGTTMDGELVFLGTLPRQGAVSLVINEGMSDGEYTTTPGVSVPLPVTTAAFSDDGSKKNLAV